MYSTAAWKLARWKLSSEVLISFAFAGWKYFMYCRFAWRSSRLDWIVTYTSMGRKSSVLMAASFSGCGGVERECEGACEMTRPRDRVSKAKESKECEGREW